MTKERKRQVIWWAIKLSIGVGLWLWLVSICDLDEFKRIWHTLSWEPLAWSVFISLVGVSSSAIPWKMLLSYLKVPLPWSQAVLLCLAGFGCNNLIPGGLGGDAFRAWVVGVRAEGRYAEPVVTVLLDRWLSFLCLMFLAFATAAVYWSELGRIGLQDVIGWVLLAFIALLGVSFILFVGKLPISQRLAQRFTMGVPVVKLSDIMWQCTKQKALMTKCYLLTLITPLLDAWIFYLISEGLHLNMPFWVYLLMVPVMRVIHHIPVSVNAVGTQDAACLFYLSAFGVSEAAALNVSMGMHVVKLSVACICGSVYLALADKMPSKEKASSASKVNKSHSN